MTRRPWGFVRVLSWIVGLGVVCGCMGKAGLLDEESSDVLTGEYLFYLSSIQGNPLAVFVAVEQMRGSSTPKNEDTKWQAHAWLVFPGGTRYLLSEKGKDEKKPESPLNLEERSLLFTTDQDRFVFYTANGPEELFFLTENLFPDRARKREEVEVRYGLIPAELHWNRRKMSGTLFYEKKKAPRLVSSFSEGVLEGLRDGGRIYTLWSPNGDFICIQKENGSEEKERWFAAMHDRRGRWQETYDVRMSEAALASDAGLADGEEIRMEVPTWGLSGTFHAVKEIQVPGDFQGGEAGEQAPVPDGPRSVRDRIQALEDVKGKAPARFLLLGGQMGRETETGPVQGLVLCPQTP